MAPSLAGAIFSIGDWKRNTGLPQSCCIRDVGSSARYTYKGATVENIGFSAMPLCAFSRAASIIGVVLASAASAQEAPLPSTYFFPSSNAAMAAALLDPHISNETKRDLAQLVEARRWPVEYQDPKTKLVWLYRPGMSPMLEGVRSPNDEAKEQKTPDGHPRTGLHGLGS